jgi:hypothetical protein
LQESWIYLTARKICGRPLISGKNLKGLTDTGAVIIMIVQRGKDADENNRIDRRNKEEYFE